VLTIVMYHYVRDASPVPARTTDDFERQLDHLTSAYTIVRCADVIEGTLPENACLLTFDDGLVEHGEYVAPALERRGVTGCFCPAGRSTLERRPLDAQKTQFLLATARDHGALAERVLERVAAERADFDIAPDDELRALNTPPHAYDPPDAVLVKRLLQDGLPDPPRAQILDELFAELVDDDERTFADRVYLTLDDLRALARRGMDIAAHGYEHRRLALLDEETQRAEIARSKQLLASVLSGPGPSRDPVPEQWAFSYPYGSRNATTRRLLAEAGCALAFTTDPRRARADEDLLELPRLDTNEVEGYETPAAAGTSAGAARSGSAR
jgi:peptidoglycan/xylan/chitin deacetylase (PgdA/CDA1 family)